VFLNALLLSRLTGELEDAGFRVLRSKVYSPNDESISLGQIAFALASINPERRLQVGRPRLSPASRPGPPAGSGPRSRPSG